MLEVLPLGRLHGKVFSWRSGAPALKGVLNRDDEGKMNWGDNFLREKGVRAGLRTEQDTRNFGDAGTEWKRKPKGNIWKGSGGDSGAGGGEMGAESRATHHLHITSEYLYPCSLWRSSSCFPSENNWVCCYLTWYTLVLEAVFHSCTGVFLRGQKILMYLCMLLFVIEGAFNKWSHDSQKQLDCVLCC